MASDSSTFSDQLFRQLVDAAPDAMVVVDEDGRVVLVNLQAETLFGYARSELSGQPMELLIPERYRGTHAGHRSRFMTAPKLRPMGSGLELFGQRKDGSEFPIEISLSPLDVDGKRLVAAAIRDVSLRRRAEQKFRALLEAAPDAMVIAGADGRIVLVNAQTERLFGYARGELYGQPVEQLMPERFQRGHVGHRSAYVMDPKTRGMGANLELAGRRKDGSEFPVEISLSPIETEDGMLVSSAIRDISERRLAEAAAKLASERLFSAVESFHGSLALYDASERLILCNSTLRALYSLAIPGPLLGMAYSELIDAALRNGLYGEVDDPAALKERLLAYHRGHDGTLDLRIAGGRTLRLTNRRTLEGGTISTAVDITDDVEHEAELRKARAEAEAASSAKSEFLSSMSHELRTPLNAILGFAQLLQRDKRAPLSSDQQQKLAYVLQGGEHLLRLIDDVLDLSRIEAGRVMVSPEPVEVGDVLSEVRQTLEPIAARAGILLSLPANDEEAVEVVADRTRFTQILLNFGSNAIKYGKRGGHAQVRVVQGEERVRLVVQDDGIGIPDSKQDKIFQPFQRAGQEAGPIEGTGIGLSISKRLAELMGGSVGFRSSPGEGSEFWVELPRYQKKGVSGKGLTASARTPSALNELSETLSIVYIEDNPSNIAFMHGLLEELPHVKLTAVPNAEVGIEVVRKLLPRVVIMDINLPGMSGYEATSKLKEWPETRDIPVIALTAAAMLADRKRLDAAGFYRYLTKPVKVAELLETLERLVASA